MRKTETLLLAGKTETSRLSVGRYRPEELQDGQNWDLTLQLLLQEKKKKDHSVPPQNSLRSLWKTRREQLINHFWTLSCYSHGKQ